MSTLADTINGAIRRGGEIFLGLPFRLIDPQKYNLGGLLVVRSDGGNFQRGDIFGTTLNDFEWVKIGLICYFFEWA